ncbi:DUF1801 domain-containing protein [Daejeonella sp.]|jgi:uncharacterized protein YdeI (YjbR/CyaY-like superfamily)|uniref:YdeI/OmpD-associated family protein n=1 Tax=Daejeonella sp. TaxID=2805397 RepID=UPI0025BDB11E|nr:DUF1801 domain-containing protein [Daejeonella sp.]
MNPRVDQYLIDGCMRCKYGATPKCKVNTWQTELKILREIALESGLIEEIKWGVPVYTHHGKNIISVNALKESANMTFFKGALLSDQHKILQQQGNIQSGRIAKFTNPEQIEKLIDVLISYIDEAIEIEKSGKKVPILKNPEPTPIELLQAFEEDQTFKKAFYSLSPGRQRGYTLHFLQAKQSVTRIARIEKYRAQILNGIGLNDR